MEISQEPYEGYDREVLENSREFSVSQLSDAVWGAVSNAYRQIRLRPARDYLSRPTQEDIPLMTSIYKAWVSQAEWMLLEGTHFESGDKRRILAKTSKRGNDVFQRRMENNLRFMESFDRIEFFEAVLVNQANNQVKTEMLWLTSTWDPSRTSLDEAWRQCSKEWNLMVTKLRKHYGKISIMKWIEAFPDESGKAWGYPHFHAVLWFHEYKFNVWLNWEKDASGREGPVYRIRERDELKEVAGWKAFSDIKALRTMDAVIDYCRKHEQGSFNLDNEDGSENKEALMNCTMQWFYHKRTYSVSRVFREKASEFIRHKRNSNGHNRQKQCKLDGSEAVPVWKWENKGIRSMSELFKVGLDESWTHEVSDPNIWDKLVRRDYLRERFQDD